MNIDKPFISTAKGPLKVARFRLLIAKVKQLRFENKYNELDQMLQNNQQLIMHIDQQFDQLNY